MRTVRHDSSYKKFFLLSIVIVTFFTLLGLLYVYENVEYTSLSYKYAQLEKEYKRLVERNQVLKYKVEKLTSPSRIEKYAKNKLGMIYPRKTVYIDIYPSEIKVTTLKIGKHIASP